MSAFAGEAALVEGLAVAVPLRMMELAELDPQDRDRRIRVWASDAAGEVASHGDDLMYGSKKSGGAAKVFNSLAKGLAAGAYCPGGVTFAGRHWCAVECLCPVGLRRTREDPVTVPADAPPRRRIVDLDLPSEDVAPGPVQMDLLDLLARP